MTPVIAWLVLYTIAIRTPVPCGDNVSCSGVNCSWTCYETVGQNHFVEFTDEEKILKFVANLKPYNHRHTLTKTVPNNERFIYGLTVETYKKRGDKWVKINEEEITRYE